MTQPQPRKSDLPVRAASAVVMVAVAGTALWLGGWVWAAFVAAVALGVLWEWDRLVATIATSSVGKVIWQIAGVVYVGLAAITLALLRDGDPGAKIILVVIGSVVATDVGAYFAGRTFGGPKIAPSISPSKTWAGLVGGAMAAGITLVGSVSLAGNPQAVSLLPLCLVLGSMVAVIAQAGDFFESWMKRRAGVKDSGNLIPGHGGLFDRVDGLLAVTFVLGIFILLAAGGTPASGGSLLPSPQ